MKQSKMVRLVVKDLNTVTPAEPNGELYVAIVPPNKVQKYKHSLASNLLVVREYWK